jgi:hypothetical protein
MIGEVKLAPVTWPEQVDEVLARLGEGIELTEVSITPQQARPGDAVEVALRWQVSAAPGVHLHSFVHVGDPARPPLAQHDGPPLGDEYPTWMWETGDVIEDQVTLTLPPDLSPGQYPMYLGLYTPDGARLPVFANGVRQPNDAYPIGSVKVE